VGQDGCVICVFGKSEYFFKRGWTGQISLIRHGNFDFRRKSNPARLDEFGVEPGGAVAPHRNARARGAADADKPVRWSNSSLLGKAYLAAK
jgi:hypothetical protein